MPKLQTECINLVWLLWLLGSPNEYITGKETVSQTWYNLVIFYKWEHPLNVTIVYWPYNKKRAVLETQTAVWRFHPRLKCSSIMGCILLRTAGPRWWDALGKFLWEETVEFQWCFSWNYWYFLEWAEFSSLCDLIMLSKMMVGRLNGRILSSGKLKCPFRTRRRKTICRALKAFLLLHPVFYVWTSSCRNQGTHFLPNPTGTQGFPEASHHLPQASRSP
jgi:hypothetical protein